MALTFAGLEQNGTVTAKDVCEVLEEYATSGARISTGVVIDLIDRTNPNQDERERMQASATKGMNDQAKRGFPSAATEYEHVLRRLIW